MPRCPFTSQSVTEAHPDETAGPIADAVLNAPVRQNPPARVAVEALPTTGRAHVTGEVTTSACAPTEGAA
ncbi:S-adenosylmethionine synthetase N-terminal domain-containing protein [Streptomyces sp. NPDC017943]|uniref:S-adenosylmethionine synthetase N-terminal domain-containing protein n=1 Tax=Streptomyces sp. NPDC017943 TaxID=3365019 RepID=UPI0037A7B1B9